VPSNAIIDLIAALWLGFIGACIGSFLNVVAYRMPLGMSVIWKPSHCPKCNHAIRPYDNVPIFGWLWLKGKCRDCGEPISPRYAIVEFVMGLAFFVLAYAELFSGGANLPGGPITEFTGAVNNFLVPNWPLIGVYAYHGVLLSLLMVVLLCNRDDEVVPISLVGFGAATTLVASMFFEWYVPPIFGNAMHPIMDHTLGFLFGSFFGSFAGRLAYRAPISCGTRPPFNLVRGSMLLGTMLGWLAIPSLLGLVVFGMILRRRQERSCSPAIVDALFFLALFQIISEGWMVRLLFA